MRYGTRTILAAVVSIAVIGTSEGRPFLDAGELRCASLDANGAMLVGGDSQHPWLSGNGRYVTYYSDADNLVPGDANGSEDVFVHDRKTGVTVLVGLGPGGGQSSGDVRLPGLSANGRVVSFAASEDDLQPGDTNGRSDAFVRRFR